MRTPALNLDNQKGAVAPLVAVLMVLLLLIVALVVDIGQIHNAKLQLQQAVDASALAGAGQLNARSDEAARARRAAEAALIANDVLARNVDLATDNVIITLGHWDTENLGAPFEERWTAGGTPLNAVQVRAAVVVPHTFFFFAPSTTVPVDAVAVQERTEMTLPLAVISCIPPTGPQAGELTACGIKTYTFSSNENTAGWSALTLGGAGGASQQDIAEFFEGDGAALFNRIADLLNTTSVAASRPLPWDEIYRGCEGNAGDSILCGLGGDFNAYLAPGTGDPLTRYNRLPRYITLSSDELDAFGDIISQDDVLFRQTGETPAQFQARLAELYADAGSAQNPYGDSRFTPVGGNEQLIRYVNDKFDFDQDGITNEKVYIPDYNRALDYAGYPPVSATTGAMSTVMDKLLEMVTPPFKQKKDIQFSSSLTRETPPFDADHVASSGAQGETLLFTIPVIFAGACGGFDPSSHDSSTAQTLEDSELHYVGLANFLVTRIWKGGDCYECRDAVTLTASLPGSMSCSLSELLDHEPSLLNNSAYACPVSGGAPIAFEGLIRPPGFGEGSTGVRVVVHLVE